MKKQTITFQIVVLALCLLLSGCGKQQGASVHNTDASPLPTAIPATPEPATEPEHLSLTLEENGKILIIDADAPAPMTEMPHIITLGDADIYAELKELLVESILPSNEEIREDGGIWFDTKGNPLAMLHSGPIFTDFENYSILTGLFIDPMFDTMRHRYISEEIPGDITMDKYEAAERAVDFFETHSIFTFSPHKILAGTDGATGYYSVYLQAAYEETPIFPITPSGNAGTKAAITNDGIVFFKGCFAFEETERRILESPFSFESTLEHFKEEFSRIIPCDITIHTISKEYMFYRVENGVYELRPAWCFYGTSNEGIETDYGFCFSMVDGAFYYTTLGLP